MKERGITQKIKEYELAGKCPLIAQVIANEQGIGAYPVHHLLEHYTNTAKALDQGWSQLRKKGLA